MSDKPRLWFRIHLSTAVVVMFVAAGLLWLNCYPHFRIDRWEWSTTEKPEGLQYNLYGWPVVGALRGPLIPRSAQDIEIYGWMEGYWEPQSLLINLCAGLLLLTAITVLSEAFIRRREALKQGTTHWFRMHRVTAVILILMATLIFCVNATGRFASHDNIETVPGTVYGWPVEAIFYADPPWWNGRVLRSGGRSRFYKPNAPELALHWFMPNSLVAAGILAANAILLEYLIRRREARGP